MNAISVAKPAPVKRQPAEAQATDSLRDYVLDSSVEPGSPLPEVELAEQLGVSRATLRTALHRLNSEGLIDRHPYRGWSVTSLSAEDVWELWTLRRSLERMAAEVVAERAEAATIDDIAARFADLEAACAGGDPDRINAADLEFHRGIIAGANHRFLQHHYRQVENQARRFIAATNNLPRFSPEEILEEHRQIMDAIASRDPGAAGDAAWQHAMPEGKRLLEMLQEG